MGHPGKYAGKKIYELRTYSIKPTCVGKYKQLTPEKYYLRTAHSKMIGHWMAEIGGLNEALHLWEYDNLAHRASVETSLSKDSKWISEYASIVHQYFDKQHNELLTIPWGELATSPSQEGGVYELRALHVGSARSTSLLQNVKDLTILQEEILQETQGKLISVFSTEFGNCNIVYQLWNYRHIDVFFDCKEALNDHPSYVELEAVVNNWNITSKLLYPLASVSPLK